VDAEENMDLVANYKIRQAPTLIVVRDGVISQFANASDIKKFAEELC
jgi:hypothetical protein